MKDAIVAFKWRPEGAARTQYHYGVVLQWPRSSNPDKNCRVLSMQNKICWPLAGDVYVAGQADERGRVPLKDAEVPYVREAVDRHLKQRKAARDPAVKRSVVGGRSTAPAIVDRGQLEPSDIPWSIVQRHSTAVPAEIALPIKGAKGGSFVSSDLQTRQFERYVLDSPGEMETLLREISLLVRSPRSLAALQVDIFGRTESDVAAELGISRDLLHAYRRQALEKAGQVLIDLLHDAA